MPPKWARMADARAATRSGVRNPPLPRSTRMNPPSPGPYLPTGPIVAIVGMNRRAESENQVDGRSSEVLASSVNRSSESSRRTSPGVRGGTTTGHADPGRSVNGGVVDYRMEDRDSHGATDGRRRQD